MEHRAETLECRVPSHYSTESLRLNNTYEVLRRIHHPRLGRSRSSWNRIGSSSCLTVVVAIISEILTSNTTTLLAALDIGVKALAILLEARRSTTLAPQFVHQLGRIRLGCVTVGGVGVVGEGSLGSRSAARLFTRKLAAECGRITRNNQSSRFLAGLVFCNRVAAFIAATIRCAQHIRAEAHAVQLQAFALPTRASDRQGILTTKGLNLLWSRGLAGRRLRLTTGRARHFVVGRSRHGPMVHWTLTGRRPIS
jgi:hypothetical protein